MVFRATVFPLCRHVANTSGIPRISSNSASTLHANHAIPAANDERKSSGPRACSDCERKYLGRLDLACLIRGDERVCDDGIELASRAALHLGHSAAELPHVLVRAGG